MLRLNNLFPTDADIEQVKEYKRTGQVPDEIIHKRRYMNKYKDFALRNNELFYTPANLQVVKKADIERVLENMYKENSSIGKGIHHYYKFIANKYINITRHDINEFLKKQPQYQFAQSIHHSINKPIISKAPNKIWSIDTCELQKYADKNTEENSRNSFITQYKYLMVVVDVFSRKVWLEKLPDKSAPQTAFAFRKVCQRAGIFPSFLMSDNGTEFKGEFKEFCEEHNIKQQFSPTYTPQANALAERAIQDIRKIIRGFFTKNKNFRWIDLVQQIEDNKNNTYNSTLKHTPNEIWSRDKNIPKKVDIPEADRENVSHPINKRLIAQENVLKVARSKLKKFEDEDNFQVGEHVRVKMSTIFSGIRKLIKDKNTKDIVVTFTPDIFTVSKVITPKQGTPSRKRYELKNSDNNHIFNREGGIKRFFASDMQRVSNNNAPPNGITMEQALKLSKVEPTMNDLIY